MADYSIIADFGNEIVKLMRDNLCPELVQNPESILLCPPFEKGEYLLGIHLYDIQTDGYYPQNEMVNIGEKQQRFPPMPVTLFYMFTVNTTTNIASKSIVEQRILCRVMQVLHDNSVFEISDIQPGAETSDEAISLSPHFLTYEDKSRIWSNSGSGSTSKLALYYKAAPILIDSTRISQPERVTSIKVKLDGKEPRHGISD
jgi:hypothetical protein